MIPNFVYYNHLRRLHLPTFRERNQYLIYDNHKVAIFHLPPGVVARYLVIHGNSATLEVECRNGVGLIPVGGNSVSIGAWIV